MIGKLKYRKRVVESSNSNFILLERVLNVANSLSVRGEGDNSVWEDTEVDGAKHTYQNDKQCHGSERDIKLCFGFFHIHENHDFQVVVKRDSTVQYGDDN